MSPLFCPTNIVVEASYLGICLKLCHSTAATSRAATNTMTQNHFLMVRRTSVREMAGPSSGASTDVASADTSEASFPRPFFFGCWIYKLCISLVYFVWFYEPGFYSASIGGTFRY